MKNGTFFYQSPIGYLELREEKENMVGVRLVAKLEEFSVQGLESTKSSLLSEACKQLDEYFVGKRKVFDLPIKYPHGTVFQHTVWDALRTIPYGTTCSYEDIAQVIGNPKAVRAIGQANTRNPLLLLVPCHRVINKSGTIGGFGCGVEVKRRLLELEGVSIK